MSKIINVAIDGPAGAGKSTVAKEVAKKLGYIYLDTGAMYRAVALKCYKLGILATDQTAVEKMLDDVKLDILHGEKGQIVMLDGEDVSTQIREHYVSKMASDVSKNHKVRLKLVDMQRDISSSKNVVVDGRDIGSFVLPNAKFKFYLTAQSSVRAKRRFDELVAKGQTADYQAVLSDVNDRDFNDMNRDFAPLKKADNSIEIDSSTMTIEQVVGYIVAVCLEKIVPNASEIVTQFEV